MLQLAMRRSRRGCLPLRCVVKLWTTLQNRERGAYLLSNVSHCMYSSNGKGRIPSGPARIDKNTVYLEDIASSGPGAPKTPAKPPGQDGTESMPPSSSKKARWRDHDPYRLPEVNMDEVVAKATATAAPDPRLATEDELRAFIEEMRPEDFDVSSSAFRELPTEVQYEIIGDLRLKSRQTSYKRLQSMLKNSKTALDFSKEQIKNLKQRNALTQQLLVTTDSIGQAHITIPVRIASERNKEYVLIKNESEVGGWVLGIRDDGTAMKPIEIDPVPVKVDSDDEDADMEDVPMYAFPIKPRIYLRYTKTTDIVLQLQAPMNRTIRIFENIVDSKH